MFVEGRLVFEFGFWPYFCPIFTTNIFRDSTYSHFGLHSLTVVRIQAVLCFADRILAVELVIALTKQSFLTVA